MVVILLVTSKNEHDHHSYIVVPIVIFLGNIKGIKYLWQCSVHPDPWSQAKGHRPYLKIKFRRVILKISD